MQNPTQSREETLSWGHFFHDYQVCNSDAQQILQLPHVDRAVEKHKDTLLKYEKMV
jgi:hypothetical protein